MNKRPNAFLTRLIKVIDVLVALTRNLPYSNTSGGTLGRNSNAYLSAKEQEQQRYERERKKQKR
ncbi:hypothetical protein IGI37_000003 [Enterococcus sp. AZ194]|uniref:hypothetical protein n=1 Tax=Enterococcus sp. AZ194 TaxID=2774629 RepID=UPI003F1E9A5D